MYRFHSLYFLGRIPLSSSAVAEEEEEAEEGKEGECLGEKEGGVGEGGCGGFGGAGC